MADTQPSPKNGLRLVTPFMQLEKEEDRGSLLTLVEQFVDARRVANLGSPPSQKDVQDK